jgi:hypothetical protein
MAHRLGLDRCRPAPRTSLAPKIRRHLGRVPEVAVDALALPSRNNATTTATRRTELPMRAVLILLTKRPRQQRTGRRRYQPWPLNEPVVPTLRGWPVERPRR